MTLVVVGSVAFDSIQTPRGRVDDVLGGSAVHFSLSSQILTPTQLVGVVGDDFPDEHRELLAERGIDLKGLETVNGKTFRWHGEYFEGMNQRETLSVQLNVFKDFEPVLPASYRDARYLFLANGAPSTQASVLEQMQGSPFVMADTMDLWIQTTRNDLESLLGRVDGLVLNDQEAFLLADQKNLIQAGHTIQKFGLRYVIIKKGEHGALLFHQDGVLALPALPLADVQDPTGAGDSFAGGIMGYLASVDSTGLKDFKRAVAWGTVLASYCCGGFGVEPLLNLSFENAAQRFQSYCRMLQVEA